MTVWHKSESREGKVRKKENYHDFNVSKVNNRLVLGYGGYKVGLTNCTKMTTWMEFS